MERVLPSAKLTISRFAAIVGGLLLLAAVVRLWDLGSVPIAVHPDELGPYVGIRDMLSGHRAPAVFIESDVVYLPLYGILEFLSAGVLGTTADALRLPGALLGVVTALATGFLATTFVPGRAAFALGAGIMAILPWDIAISRVGWEPAAMLPTLVFGLYVLRRGLAGRSPGAIVGAAAILAVGCYSYRAALFDAVTMSAVVLAVEPRRTLAALRPLALGLLVFVAILAPLGTSALLHPSYISSGPAQMTFANGVNDLSLGIFRQRYLAEFSPTALFAVGDGNLQHGPHFGVLYWWMLPFIALGLLAPPALLRLGDRLLLAGWLALYPIGNAVVNEIPQQHFVRTLSGAPVFTVAAVVGLIAAWHAVRRLRAERLRVGLLAAFAAIVVFGFARFSAEYFVRYPGESAADFQYGDRELFAFVRAHAAGHARVCFTAVGGWNWTTLTRYYLSDFPLEIHARIEDGCGRPGTLYAVERRSDAPADAQLIGTVQHWDGTVSAYFLEGRRE